MKLIEELQARLAGYNLSEVARRAGMSYSSVHLIASGKQRDMKITTYSILISVMNVMDGEGEQEAN